MKKILALCGLIFLGAQPLFAAEIKLTQNEIQNYNRLNTIILDQDYYYNIKGRDLTAIIKEINIDMYNHVFLNPLIKHRNIKIFADLERNDLVLYVQVINGHRHHVASFKEISSPTELINKVSEYVENEWALYKLFSFLPEFELPRWDTFNNLETISKADIETMAKYYLEKLKEVKPEALEQLSSKLVSSYYFQ